MGTNTIVDGAASGCVRLNAAGVMEAKGTAECAAAHAAVALLRQAAMFIEVIDDQAYSRVSGVMPGGTIGKHFRHLVDHISAAAAPLRAEGRGAAEGCVIDYDHRERDVPMETCRRTALAEIRSLVGELCGMRREQSGAPVVVRVMLSADGAEERFGSTLGRELAFAAHHAVHHHAMIGAIAAEWGITAPPGFGKAPSTLQHETATRC